MANDDTPRQQRAILVHNIFNLTPIVTKWNLFFHFINWRHCVVVLRSMFSFRVFLWNEIKWMSTFHNAVLFSISWPARKMRTLKTRNLTVVVDVLWDQVQSPTREISDDTREVYVVSHMYIRHTCIVKMIRDIQLRESHSSISVELEQL